MERLLVATLLDGSILGIDRQTGYILWSMDGSPLISSTSPMFLPDIYGQLYFFTQSLQKLPISIKQIANRMPVFYFNGLVFTSTKEASFVQVNDQPLHQIIPSHLKSNENIRLAKYKYSILIHNQERLIGNVTFTEYSHLATMDAGTFIGDKPSLQSSIIYDSNDQLLIYNDNVYHWESSIGLPTMIFESIRTSQGPIARPIYTYDSAAIMSSDTSTIKIVHVHSFHGSLVIYPFPSSKYLSMSKEVATRRNIHDCFHYSDGNDWSCLEGYHSVTDYVLDETRMIEAPPSTSKPILNSIVLGVILLMIFGLFGYFFFWPSSLKKKKKKKKPKQKSNSPSHLCLSEDIIGYGSNGTIVYKGTFNGRPVAIKRLLVDFFDTAQREIALLQDSDHHPNVVRYFFQEQTGNFFYIALELCDMNLSQLIEVECEEHPETRSLINPALLKQMADGLHFLHFHNIVHRDLKPHNILISRTALLEGQSVRILISDFGLSKKGDSENQATLNSVLPSGSIGWRCVESINRMNMANPTPVDIGFFMSSDIFSLGCIFYYTFTIGHHPFGDDLLTRDANILNHRLDISYLQPNRALDLELRDLISKMISKSGKDRPMSSNILEHPIFWETIKKLEYLQLVSDRLEKMNREEELVQRLDRTPHHLYENRWTLAIDTRLLIGYRRYDDKKLQDLLRLLRNKKNHFDEIEPHLKNLMGNSIIGLYDYFIEKFPGLFIHVYQLMHAEIQ